MHAQKPDGARQARHLMSSASNSWARMQALVQVSWQRVRVANALADSGEEWVKMLDTLNSGTYNNQYMVSLCGTCLVMADAPLRQAVSGKGAAGVAPQA